MAKLTWSPRLLSDLELIYEYIKHDSEENASNFIKQLITSTIDITEFPFSGRTVPEFKENRIREKLYKNYRIGRDKVGVVTVLHQSRRLT